MDSLLSEIPTVCPKLLWKKVQDIAKAVDILITTDTFENNNDFFIIIILRLLTSLYDIFINDPTDSNKENIVSNLNKQDHKIQIMFNVYIRYKKILSKNLFCKELNSDFILFIPEPSYHNSLPKQFYQNLKDWNYKEFKNNVSILLKESYILSEKLLSALDSLKLKNIPVKQQTYINVHLTGQGNQDTNAGLSILHSKNNELSQFLKFLKILNIDFNTKSLGISTCFIGGKKNIDAYNISNKFNNQLLESIKYPILNNGTSYSLTYGFSPTDVKKYLKAGANPNYKDFANQTPLSIAVLLTI